MSNELTVLPPNVASRGVTVAQWNTLCDSLFPGAKPDSVLMVLDYCKARGLDPLKKPCHIVPMSVKTPDGYKTRDVVMPGIYEYRMTAHKTGLYLGHSEPEYGPKIKVFGVEAPEWCRMTMYRWHEASRSKVEFPAFVYFKEVVATRWDKDAKESFANERWFKAPIQMMTKCCEAAGLREAFPDELGGTHTEDEMYGKAIDAVNDTKWLDMPEKMTRKVVEGEQAQEEKKRRGKPATREPVRATVKNGGVTHDDPPPAEPSGDIAKGSSAQGRTTAPVRDHKQEDPADDPIEYEDDHPGPPDTIIKSQQTLLEHRLKAANIPVNEFLAKFEIGAIAELPFDQMQDAKEWIEQQ